MNAVSNMLTFRSSFDYHMYIFFSKSCLNRILLKQSHSIWSAMLRHGSWIGQKMLHRIRKDCAFSKYLYFHFSIYLFIRNHLIWIFTVCTLVIKSQSYMAWNKCFWEILWNFEDVNFFVRFFSISKLNRLPSSPMAEDLKICPNRIRFCFLLKSLNLFRFNP